MQGFQIQNIRDFTRLLFMEKDLDGFLVPEAEILCDFRTSFDGRLQKPNTENGVPLPEDTVSEAYISWGELRPVIFSLLKGRTLRSFSLVLCLSKAKTEALIKSMNLSVMPEEVQTLCLNIRYGRDQLTLTSGCALTHFSLDRSLDKAWDRQVSALLDRLGIRCL